MLLDFCGGSAVCWPTCLVGQPLAAPDSLVIVSALAFVADTFSMGPACEENVKSSGKCGEEGEVGEGDEVTWYGAGLCATITG